MTRLYNEPNEPDGEKTESPEPPPSAIATDVTDAVAFFEPQEMPQMIPDEEVMGAVDCAALVITVLNGLRIVIAPTGMPDGRGQAYALADKAGELLNQHLHGPEAIIDVTSNALAI